MAGTDVDAALPLDVDDDEPLRWYVVALYVLLVVGGFALGVWLTVSWYVDCQDGTGRSTSFAGDSTRASVCHAAHGAPGLLIPLGWVLGLVLATLALARWGGGALRVLALTVVFLTPAALPAAAYGGLGLSGTDCTGSKLTTYRAWVDAGSKGQAPYDCRKF